MEPLGDQWTNVLLNGIFSNEDDDVNTDHFMAHLLNDNSASQSNEFLTNFCNFPSLFRPSNSYPIDEYQMYPSFDNSTDNMFSSSHSQDSNFSNRESYYSLSETINHQSSSYSFGLMNNDVTSINFGSGEKKPEENTVLPQISNNLSMENPKKRSSRIISTDHEIVDSQKKRNVKPKNNRQSSKTSSCCCSDSCENICNSSINSQSQSQSEDVNIGRGRGSKGSGSDPQSFYARKRREKINERLRILQSLVPNGTKVDISTMLEDAVHYVKFLQLQIKLLSSDEHWMYAPIAYNGMDIGLHMSIPTSTPTTTSS